MINYTPRNNDETRIVLGRVQKRYTMTEGVKKAMFNHIMKGLPENIINDCLNKFNNPRAIEIYLTCLENGYDMAVTDYICADGITIKQMEALYSIYRESGSYELMVSIDKEAEKDPDKMMALFENDQKEIPKEVKVDEIEELKKAISSLDEKVEKFSTTVQEILDSKTMKDVDKKLNFLKGSIDKLKEDNKVLENSVKAFEKNKSDEMIPIMKNGSVETYAMAEYSSGRRNMNYGFMEMMFKHRSRRDIVKLCSRGELEPEQIQQIGIAMKRGLSEKQLLELINNNVSAQKMKMVIEIAVLQNNMKH